MRNNNNKSTVNINKINYLMQKHLQLHYKMTVNIHYIANEGKL